MLRQKPVSGRRKFLPLRAISLCPLCDEAVRTNVHPLERRTALALELFIGIGFIVGFWYQTMVVLVGLLLATAILLSALFLVNHRYLKNWQRYAPLVAPYPCVQPDGPVRGFLFASIGAARRLT